MFASAEFKANPYPTYTRLRAQGSIQRMEAYGGSWLLLGYADVAQALSDSRLSSRRSHLMVSRLPRAVQKEFAEFNRILSLWLQFLDPPQHSRLRQLMDKSFKLSWLQTMRPQIQNIADSLLDRVQGADKMEFMADFAYPLPGLVIAQMLGVSPAERADFLRWSDDIATFQGPQPTLEVARRAQNSLLAMLEYFRAILPERRQNLGEDLISLLIRAEADGEMNSEQLLAQCAALLVGGHETTRNLLGNGLLALLQHREQWEMLQRDRSLLPNALRELLRYESPIQFVARLATEEFTLDDQRIQPGAFVTCAIGAANRDPAKFKNPNILDITRKDCAHLAFGRGPHVCIGATLTYLEAEIAFNTLLDRLPNLQLVDDIPEWNPKVALRALKTLMLTF